MGIYTEEKIYFPGQRLNCISGPNKIMYLLMIGWKGKGEELIISGELHFLLLLKSVLREINLC